MKKCFQFTHHPSCIGELVHSVAIICVGPSPISDPSSYYEVKLQTLAVCALYFLEATLLVAATACG
jgi:hypothetical protein